MHHVSSRERLKARYEVNWSYSGLMAGRVSAAGKQQRIAYKTNNNTNDHMSVQLFNHEWVKGWIFTKQYLLKTDFLAWRCTRITVLAECCSRLFCSSHHSPSMIYPLLLRWSQVVTVALTRLTACRGSRYSTSGDCNLGFPLLRTLRNLPFRKMSMLNVSSLVRLGFCSQE